ncbi:hypothetical protein RMP76_137 [Saccharomyces cerevisiae synthetic construct]|uniref:Putative uncharacterized protein YHR071C-A n=1 Tax=Saccharomyces cerevisiae (strain ATCC 204508 / S288c) TaxID=559292 RepID=YH071_YEAST|nr:RecName: Full=Putative uncharacterized protein YHR071C-A [Saccharomyces cerevisiae S288C]AHX39304.1 hypothetical protein YHR071C-A [Saccharomyces cerevisiae]WNM96996.1 hypothetical protein RMP76_137 [Saccharomyces cerevisiae synthetic construct]
MVGRLRLAEGLNIPSFLGLAHQFSVSKDVDLSLVDRLCQNKILSSVLYFLCGRRLLVRLLGTAVHYWRGLCSMALLKAEGMYYIFFFLRKCISVNNRYKNFSPKRL